jgi:hypothetical protein
VLIAMQKTDDACGNRLWGLLLLSLCGVLTEAHAGGKVRRDWTTHPAVVQTDFNQDLFVLGDAHGDADRLFKALKGSGLVTGKTPDPARMKWAAGKATVVFMGDLIDKGKHSLKVIELVRLLGSEARTQGGQVIVLMGNHEAEFLADPTSHKVEEFASELDDEGLSAEAVAACHGDVGEFLCSLPFAARIGDWFFAHGGNTDGRSMNQLIADLQEGVDQDGFATEQLIGQNSILEARLGETPWFEGDRQRDEKQVLSAYAQALGVAHIVEGHQPGSVQFADGMKRKSGAMFQRYGLIFLVDTGMSDAVDKSQGGVLRIKASGNHRATAICPSGEKTTLWDEDTKPEVGKAAPCGKS